MARLNAGAYEVSLKFNLMRSFCGPPRYEARRLAFKRFEATRPHLIL